MEIYLIRHTKVHNPDKLCYGQSDIQLAANWENDIAALCHKLKFDAQTVVYSSPFKRCTDLAQAISNTDFVQTPELSEMHFGDWEQKGWDSLDQEILNLWMADFVNFQVPGGESFKVMHKRCSNFWDELISKDHEKVLIVTHAGVIRSVLAHVLDIPLKNIFQLQVDYGSVSKVTYEPKFKSLVVNFVNQV
ncbi:MAG: hypothetical protein JWQ25_2320 [Daejeonella sp.]|nr:hypothetical protein [Daejeonella sp.]